MPESSMEDKSKPEVRSYSWWNWRRSKSSVDATTGQLSMDSPSVHKSEAKLELELQGDTQTMDETTPKIEIQNENDPTKRKFYNFGKLNTINCLFNSILPILLCMLDDISCFLTKYLASNSV